MAIKKKKENIADQIINGTYNSKNNLKNNFVERTSIVDRVQQRLNNTGNNTTNKISNLNVLATREPEKTKTGIWDNVKQRAMSMTNQNMQRARTTQINSNNFLNMSQQNRVNNSKINQQRTPFLMDKKNEVNQNTTAKNPLELKNEMKLADISKGLPNSKNVSEETLYNISNIKNKVERNKLISGLTKSKKEQDKLRIKVNALVQERETSEKANTINNRIETAGFIQDQFNQLTGNKNHLDKAYTGLQAGKRFISSLGHGALNYGLDIAGTMQSLSPQSDDNFVNTAKQLGSKNSQVNAKIKNPIVSGAGRAGETIGFMIPSIVASAVAPEGNLSGVVNAVGVGSSSYLENLDEEQTNKLESLLTGVAKGAVSYKIEQLSDGNFLSKGKSSLSKEQVKGLSNVSNNMVKWFKAKASEIGGEVAEENLENVAGYIIDYLINEKKITADELIEEAKQTSIDTFTTTALLNVLGLGGNTYRQSQQYETSRDLLFNTNLDNTAKDIILNDVLEGKRTSNDVFALLYGQSDTELNNQIIDSSKMDENSKQAMKKVAEENELGINEVQYLIDNTLQGKYAQNQSTTIQNKEVLQNNQQVVQSDTKTAQNGNTEQMKPILQNYLKNASENGADVQNKTVKSIYEVTQRRGIVAEYNADVFKDKNGKVDENKNAVWTTDENGNRKILINPNANTETTLQNIMVHELTHDFEGSKEYEALSKLALDKMKTQEGYLEARKDLERIYSQVYDKNSKEFQTLVDQEAVANFLGENLGNQEFINELVNSQPRTTIQKIYDWIVDKIAKVTGNEKLYWKNVEQKFKNAYNSQNENSSQDSKYSIAGRKAIENLKSNPSYYKQAIDMYKLAKKMAKQGEKNSKIIKETGWFKDDTGKLKFSFSDKDMDLKNVKFKENKTYNLEDVVEHDALFLLYPQLRNYKVMFEDMNKNKNSKDGTLHGSYNRLSKIIKLDINRARIKQDAEGTLIHEIQHAIQDIEGFTGGTSRKLGKKQYEKNLGEIEARDTTKRFIEEKYEQHDLSNVIPESAKLDRNMLEKMKDGLYNYLNKFSKGVSYEEIDGKDKTLIRQNRDMVVGRVNENNVENSNKSSFSMEEINSKVNSDNNINKLNEDGITMTYVRMLNQNTQNYGATYGQNIEPAGEYMSMDTMKGKYKVPGAEYGTIHFNNPLILDHINTTENGWKKTLSEMFDNKTGEKLSNAIKKSGYDAIITIDEDGNYNEIVNLNGTKNENSEKGSFSMPKLKEKQLEIINKSNPMLDDYHLGIRSIEDIKTFDEVINDDESFVYGDFSKEDAEKALEKGTVTVYSSKPIEQGSFVSTSKNMAQDYAGRNGKVYSQEVSLNDVAWINGDEGQYAKVDNIKYSYQSNGAWNDFLKKHSINKGTGETMQQVKLPQMPIEQFQKVLDTAQHIPQEEKTYLLETVKDIKRNKTSLEDFKNTIETMEKAYDEQNENILDTKKTYNTGRREIYQKYMKAKGEYDTSSLDNAKKIISANHQGRRTKAQWLNIAKQMGTEIANKSNAEIEEIAYRTWQDERPSNKDSLNRQGEKFVTFTSDEWINTIYDTVKEQREKYSIDTEKVISEKSFAKKEQEIKDDFERKKKYIELQSDKQMAEKKIKGLSMQASAEIRKINQGDFLIPVENGLTAIELENKIKYLKSNHIGKKVIVENKQGTIIGNAYGKIGVKFEDGTQKYFDKESVKPLVNIDDIIKKQKEEKHANEQQQKRKIVDEVYREEINDGKTRKHYKSIFESDQIGKTGKDVAKELYKTDTYTPISNLDTITEANKNIGRNGVEATYNAFRTKLRTNEKVTLQDIATGERLIQIYSQNGDYQKVNDLIQDVAILGTELGQQVQAFSLIKKASPEGQLQYLKKLVDRTNIKEDTDIKVTEDMTKKILESKNENELEKNMSDVAVEIAEQLPISRRDKIRSWRYLSMLGNPKTHIKNVGANVFMNLTQSAKNIVAGGVEDVVGTFNKNLEKTKTLKPANKEQKNFAKQDAEYMQDLIDGGGKFDVGNIIQNNKKQFDNKMLNKIAEFNSDMLDVEDKIFLKLAYKQAMQNYMSANKLKANDMQGKILEKARQYASIQAQEATFHQFNALANTLNQVENRGGVGGKIVEAILPFKKTPMNIAKEGLEYSPVGLAKSITYDLGQLSAKTNAYKKQLKEGKITQEQYKAETSKLATKTIDNFAKGFTGSSIAVLGYFLSQAGILKAGNDGDDDEFKESLGEQEYAIKIGDNTYTLDWISPSAIPLFTGATIQQLRSGETKADGSLINSTMTGLAKSFEPMTEMSMLQGLTSAISSYEKGSNMFFDLFASMTTSYLGQFIPTALGQVARTIDPYERDTSTTKKGIESKTDRFVKQTMNKIPGISQKLPVKKDVWGNDKKRANNVGVRLLENAILPFNRKELIADRTDKELLKVFDETGEKVLPSAPSKDLTINKQKYRMTSKEYNDARKTFGQTSKKLLDDLFSSKDYLSLSSEGRAKAIQDVYSYAKEELKKQYADSKGQELKTSKLYNTVSELKEQKGNVSAYFEFKGKLDDLDRANGEESLKDKQKLEYLGKLKENDSTKRIIYEDTFGTKDKVYSGLKKLTNNAVSINDYLNYKISDFSADKEDDGTLNGKTISGSAKQKVVDFINNSNFSDIEKLYLRGTKNKLDTSQRNQFAEYIDTLNLSDEDVKAIYLTLNGVVEMSDGSIKWK